MSKTIKPFIKWVGGKTQILEQVSKNFPNTMTNYHEPFVGGGSVLLHVLELQKENKLHIEYKVYAYDTNIVLINTYKAIQNNLDSLVKNMTEFVNKYNNCEDIKLEKVSFNPETEEEGLLSKENYYYWLRKTFNTLDKNTIKACALFIVLNKLCFRGIYREGPNGFNVPYGHYKNPSIFSEIHLKKIQELIKDVVFNVSSFEISMRDITDNDFVYFDPPYAPETSTSFVKYNKDGFNLEQHKLLFKMINESNYKFVMSNSNEKLVLDNFKNYTIQKVECKRRVNSKKPQSTTMEVLIYN